MKDDRKLLSTGEWKPEAELILRCARGHLDTASAARIEQLLSSGLDWDCVLRSSEWHRLTPLLYRNLVHTGARAVPEVVLDRLKEETRRYSLATLVSRTELSKVLEGMKDAQIPTVPLKGPALASHIYPEGWLRAPGDLDVLVRKQNVLKAKDLLVSLGYRPELRMTPAQEASYIRSEGEYNFNLDDPLIHLELHWRIVPPSFPFSLDYEDLWQHTQETSCEGERMLTFGPEDLLLILCIHGLKHCWERLKWVCDLAELIRAYPGLNWDGVVDQAASIGGRRTLYLGLFLARNLLGADLPHRFLEAAAADKAVRSLAAEVCKKLFREPYLPRLRRTTLTICRFRIGASDCFSEKIVQCFHCFRLVLTPHPADRETLRLPDALSFSYYLIRPIRLLAKHGVAVARSILGAPK